MSERFDRLFYFGRTVTFEVPEILHETNSGILVEYNRQSAWFPKARVQIDRSINGVVLKVPRWLFERKFS